jgi:hypothetical protein
MHILFEIYSFLFEIKSIDGKSSCRAREGSLIRNYLAEQEGFLNKILYCKAREV